MWSGASSSTWCADVSTSNIIVAYLIEKELEHKWLSAAKTMDDT
jgi:hypothetical protein